MLRLEGAIPVEGGIPLLVDGKIVGAIGVSGRISQQDSQCAQAGASTMPPWAAPRNAAAVRVYFVRGGGYAEASITITKGDSEIDTEIVDAAFNQLLVAPFAMFLKAGYERKATTATKNRQRSAAIRAGRSGARTTSVAS